MSDLVIRRLAIVLGVAVGLWGLVALVRWAREDRVADFALPRVDTAAVDSVSLVRRGDSVLLARGERGAWTANGYAADSTRIVELLRALADTSMWSELVAQARSSHAQLGVDADSGRHVRVSSRGKALLELIAGKRTSDWRGVYVRRPAEDAVYALHGDAVGDPLQRSSDDWRDRRIARVQVDSVTQIELRRAGRATVLRKQGARWSLAGGAAADSAAVANLLDAYKDVSASGFATPAQADSARLDRPRIAVTLRDAKRVVLSLTIDSTASAVWARSGASPIVYKIDTWQLSRLVPSDSTLRAKKR